MAQPPGNAIFAYPYFATIDPKTRIDARIVFTSSYLASRFDRFEVFSLKFIFSSREISAPIEPISSNMVVMS